MRKKLYTISKMFFFIISIFIGITALKYCNNIFDLQLLPRDIKTSVSEKWIVFLYYSIYCIIIVFLTKFNKINSICNNIINVLTTIFLLFNMIFVFIKFINLPNDFNMVISFSSSYVLMLIAFGVIIKSLNLIKLNNKLQ
ncbi:Uncharacterised protein [Clostridium putrefaciens]|uniref:Uncharacterized protein n=1 Tax=Clostridium putrefaciens TaxID=99675 RepID=A0A381J988_9CLOT|nr:Uncharacterised protein [Clostridium putrefaciens]